MGEAVTPGWAERIERDQYWIRLTLHEPVNEQWLEKTEGIGRVAS
jgi:hypothetical protein